MLRSLARLSGVERPIRPGGLAVWLAVAVLAALLQGALARGYLPRAAWHEGPIAADLDSELKPRHFAAAPGAAAGAVEAEARPATVAHTLQVKRGDTLMSILLKAGLERGEAHEAITALRKIYSPRKLKPGQEIRLTLAAAEAARLGSRLLTLSLQPSVERDLRVTRTPANGFVAETFDRPLDRRLVSAEGTIENNLSSAGRSAGLPMPILVELIRVFSFDVDFQRDLQPGDDFEVLYAALFEQDGRLAKTDNILYASLTLSGQRLEMYTFTPKSGISDFFDPKGQSVRKTLMRTPIDGARLSSRYGMRRHPILGYSRMHRGIDFAAPRGTPIYAAGDGVVETAGRNGAYGKYVRIRHNSTYKTAYAHMSRLAKAARRGKRVRQGQTIGYVGSSGRSTGAHLHYEVLRRGRQVDPRKIKLPSGKKLKGEDLEKFLARRAEIDELRQRTREGETLMAGTGCPLAEVAAKRPGPDDC